jgi:hypothetical protein
MVEDAGNEHGGDDGGGGPQNTSPQPGSFQACVGGLGGTGFTQDAANLINQISGSQGTSRDLLAVTWMNENHFNPTPGPNTNGHNGDALSGDYSHWDVGPFHINIGYTLAAISAGTAKWPQIRNGVFADKYGVFGYTFYDSSGKTPTNTFDGVPLQNGLMAAQRLNGLGSNDRDRAVNYAGQKNGPARGRSYDTWHNAFANFFKCYRGY